MGLSQCQYRATPFTEEKADHGWHYVISRKKSHATVPSMGQYLLLFFYKAGAGSSVTVPAMVGSMF